MASGFLSAKEIQGLLHPAVQTPPLDPLVTDGNPTVEGMSLILTVGAIFVPSTEDEKLGGAQKPRKSLSLKQGETAVLRTAEKLTMPPHVGAVGFPPSRLSLKGLLTTNPGHVAPGYEGQLHLTVINMSSEPLDLHEGLGIMKLLLFYVDDQIDKFILPNPIDTELLERLSRDFLDIEARAKSAAGKAVILGQIWVPIVTAIITAAVTLAVAYFAYIGGQSDKLRELDAKVSILDGELNPKATTVELKNVDRRLKAIETKEKIAPEQSQPQ